MTENISAITRNKDIFSAENIHMFILCQRVTASNICTTILRRINQYMTENIQTPTGNIVAIPHYKDIFSTENISGIPRYEDIFST